MRRARTPRSEAKLAETKDAIVIVNNYTYSRDASWSFRVVVLVLMNGGVSKNLYRTSCVSLLLKIIAIHN